MSEDNKHESQSKEAQTILHVTPHLLAQNEKALVKSNHFTQTAVTSVPIEANTDVLFALLEFIPYKDIEEECIKELELPRKQRLQFHFSENEDNVEVSSTGSERRSSIKSQLDENSDITSTASSPVVLRPFHKPKKRTCEKEIQTNLTVAPHVLDDDEVAKVYMELSTQTVLTMPTKASLSKIIPLLKNANEENASSSHKPSFVSQNVRDEAVGGVKLTSKTSTVETQIKRTLEATMTVLQYELNKIAMLLDNVNQICITDESTCKVFTGRCEKCSKDIADNVDNATSKEPNKQPGNVDSFNALSNQSSPQSIKKEPSNSSSPETAFSNVGNAQNSKNETNVSDERRTKGETNLNIWHQLNNPNTCSQDQKQKTPNYRNQFINKRCTASTTVSYEHIEKCYTEKLDVCSKKKPKPEHVNVTSVDERVIRLPMNKTQNALTDPNNKIGNDRKGNGHGIGNELAFGSKLTRGDVRGFCHDNAKHKKVKFANVQQSTSSGRGIVLYIKRPGSRRSYRVRIKSTNDQSPRKVVNMTEQTGDGEVGHATQEDSLLRSSSVIFEQDATYSEQYMEELIDVTAAIQTDLQTNESNSLSSLSSIPQDSEMCRCSGYRAEIPWQVISLPKPGTYIISRERVVKISETGDQAAAKGKEGGHEDGSSAKESDAAEAVVSAGSPKNVVTDGGKEQAEAGKSEDQGANDVQGGNVVQPGNSGQVENAKGEESGGQDKDVVQAANEKRPIGEEDDMPIVGEVPPQSRKQDENLSANEMNSLSGGPSENEEEIKNIKNFDDDAEEDEEQPGENKGEADKVNKEEKVEEVSGQGEDEGNGAQDQQDQGAAGGGEDGGDKKGEGEDGEGGGEEGNAGGAQEEAQQEEGAVGEEIPMTGPPASMIYDSSTENKYLEPYMEGLLKIFEEKVEEEPTICGSRTEIPWNDIVLPKKCNIMKTKRKEQESEKCPGPSCYGPVDNNPIFDDENVIEIEITFPEKLSQITPVDQGAAASQATISTCSAISGFLPAPRRCQKEFVLQVSVNAGSTTGVSVKDCQGGNKPLEFGATLKVSESMPFTVSALRANEKSSVIISIKPSTECPYESEYLPVTEVPVNPSVLSSFKEPTEVKSCSAACMPTTSCVNNCGIANKSSASMPQIQKQPAEEPQATANKKEEPVKEVYVPPRCTCKDAEKPNTFKTDPVMAALEAYESEMKPLRKALTELQQKIKNLNLPEMKGCLCTVALNDPTGGQPGGQTIPGAVTATCPSYQPFAFKKPSPSQNYYNYPPLNLPSKMPAYVPQAYYPPYTPPTSAQSPLAATHSYALQPEFSGNWQTCNCPSTSRYSPDDPSQKYKTSPDWRSQRPGPSPDYAYVNPCTPQSPCYALESVMSSREFADRNSDMSTTLSCGCPEDDSEFVCPFMELVRSMVKSERTKKKRARKQKYGCTAPCADVTTDEEYRVGKSLKTDPKNFCTSAPAMAMKENPRRESFDQKKCSAFHR